jgi:hypothetical protein
VAVLGDWSLALFQRTPAQTQCSLFEPVRQGRVSFRAGGGALVFGLEFSLTLGSQPLALDPAETLLKGFDPGSE